MDRQRGRSGASQTLDSASVGGRELQQAHRRRCRLCRARNDGICEEFKPCFPIACLAYAVQQFVVCLPVLLEVQAQVEQWLAQQSVVGELQRDEQAADASVAIEKRVNRLELHVRERRLGKRWRYLWAIVQEALEIFQAVGDLAC